MNYNMGYIGILVMAAVPIISSHQTSAMFPADDAGLPQGVDGVKGSYEDIIRGLNDDALQQVQLTSIGATLSLAQLRERQLRWREAIESVQVDFECSIDRQLETPTDTENRKHGMLLPKHLGMRQTYAIKGIKRYSNYLDDQNASFPTDAARSPGDLRFAFVFNGHESRSLNYHDAIGQIRPGKVSGIENNASWYFNLVSIPTGPDADKDVKTGWCVLGALEQPERYSVLPTLQKVDGFLCHVVSSGAVTFWLDADHGCCLRRQVQFRRKSKTDPGSLSQLQMSREYVEVQPGIWLPYGGYRISYATSVEPASIQGKVTSIASIRVRDLRVNSVPDSLFELAFPPGSQVHDLILNKAYTMPQGEEHMSRALAEAREIIDGKVMAADNRGWFRKHMWTVTSVLGILLCCYLVVKLRGRYMLPPNIREMQP